MKLYARLLLALLLLLAVPAALVVATVQLERQHHHLAEQRIMAYAEVLANQLSQHQHWLMERQSLAETLQATPQLLPAVPADITIDGYTRDWASMIDNSRWLGRNELRSLSAEIPWTPQSLSLRQLAGHDGRYAYLLLMVRDDVRQFRRDNYLRIDLNDHVELLVTDEAGRPQRFLFAPKKAGRIEARKMPSDPSNWVPVGVDTRFRGEWRETDGGYNVELRLPLSMIAGGFSFAVTDMDSSDQQPPLTSIGASIATKPGTTNENTAPLPTAIMATLNSLPVRIWLIDPLGRVAATGGQPQAAANVHRAASERRQKYARSLATSAGKQWWQSRLNRPLSPWRFNFYRQIAERSGLASFWQPQKQRRHNWNERQPGNAEQVKQARDGQPATRWQPGAEGLWLISAATPVPGKQQPQLASKAVVVAEQWQGSSMLLLQPATLRLFELALLASLIAIFSIALLASGLVWRLRRLRRSQLDAISGTLPTGDDIERIEYAANQLVAEKDQAERLRRSQNQRLSLALQTPLTTVASSIELAQGATAAEDQHNYLRKAARAGAELTGVLEILSAEKRLQQLLESSAPQSVELPTILRRATENWLSLHPAQSLTLNLPASPASCVTIPGPLSLVLHEMLSYGQQTGQALQLSLRPHRRGYEIELSGKSCKQGTNQRAGSGPGQNDSILGLALSKVAFRELGGKITQPAEGSLPVTALLPCAK